MVKGRPGLGFYSVSGYIFKTKIFLPSPGAFSTKPCVVISSPLCVAKRHILSFSYIRFKVTPFKCLMQLSWPILIKPEIRGKVNFLRVFCNTPESSNYQTSI